MDLTEDSARSAQVQFIAATGGMFQGVLAPVDGSLYWLFGT